MVLCISVLSGIGFTYTVANTENEMILLVDSTYSTKEQEQAKDEYVEQIINLCDKSSIKLGIVTFGYDQVYAVPLTNDLDEAYNDYLNAEKPNNTATDIAAALTYTKDLFTNTESAKIVLISDGVETDERAISTIRSISADGIRIDTVTCQSYVPDEEVLLLSVTTPDYNVVVGESFDLELTLKSKNAGQSSVTVLLYDNDTECYRADVSVAEGVQTITIPHSFEEENLHILHFSISSSKDKISENNSIYTYMYLEEHSKVLVIESTAGESEELSKMLANYNVTVLNTKIDTLPETLDDLRQYDEVILNNIANSDLPEGFDEILNAYVYQIGGGLFTVGGGEDGDPETAHSYNRDDLAGTLYQQMLPVQAINYTPPLGLAIVIDVSGSMTMASGDTTRLDAAKDSALTIVRDTDCLSERDYCCVLTLSDSYTVETKPLPMTSQDKIIDSIYNISTGNNTAFTAAIKKASSELRALYEEGKIEKMHVIIITDGGASDYDEYLPQVEYYNALGVTFSFVAIDASETNMSQLQTAAEAGGGQAINAKVDDLTRLLRADIIIPEIKEVEYGEFVPTIKNDTVYSNVLSQEDMPSLYGFYGTKARTDAEVILTGNYGVPIYAQWKYGAGMVGSFMCDLSGVWSADFIEAEAGTNFILSVVNKLFPLNNIRPQDIEVRLTEDNYSTTMSIYTSTELEETESVTVSVTNLTTNTTADVVEPTSAESFSRATFYTTTPGVYNVLIKRVDAEGQTVSEYSFYQSFSYSAEYSELDENTDYSAVMQEYADLSGGSVVAFTDDDVFNVFEGFATRLAKSYDPTLALMIIAVVLFLLDIAVRKFKFKWIHELVAEYKQKKASAKSE
jgi:Mg-chelatase subunit ChlD